MHICWRISEDTCYMDVSTQVRSKLLCLLQFSMTVTEKAESIKQAKINKNKNCAYVILF